MGYGTLARVLVTHYPDRSLVSLALMASQSFLYNAIFFTYGLVLTHFYGVAPNAVPHYFYASRSAISSARSSSAGFSTPSAGSA